MQNAACSHGIHGENPHRASPTLYGAIGVGELTLLREAVHGLGERNEQAQINAANLPFLTLNLTQSGQAILLSTVQDPFSWYCSPHAPFTKSISSTILLSSIVRSFILLVFCNGIIFDTLPDQAKEGRLHSFIDSSFYLLLF